MTAHSHRFRSAAWGFSVGFGRGLVGAGAVGFVAVVAGLVFMWVWPQDWTGRGYWYLMGAAAAFGVGLVRVHVGMLCLVGGAGLAMIGGWRWKGGLRGKPRGVAGMVAVGAFGVAVGLVGAGPAMWAAIPPLLGEGSHDAGSPPGAPMRVLALNLAYDNYDTQAMVRAVQRADADVVLFEEIRPRQQRAIDQALGRRYAYWNLSSLRGGLACASKWPLEVDGEGQGKVPKRLRGRHRRGGMPWIRQVVRHDGHRVAVYGVHLTKPDTLKAFYRSRLELAALRQTLARETLPRMVGGDFNFSQWTPNAAALREVGLHTAFSDAGSGLGITRPWHESIFRYMPWTGVRIDHLFLSHGLQALDYGLVKHTGSDHRGVMAQIVLNKATTRLTQ